jgi:hypothetical protein
MQFITHRDRTFLASQFVFLPLRLVPGMTLSGIGGDRSGVETLIKEVEYDVSTGHTVIMLEDNKWADEATDDPSVEYEKYGWTVSDESGPKE